MAISNFSAKVQPQTQAQGQQQELIKSEFWLNFGIIHKDDEASTSITGLGVPLDNWKVAPSQFNKPLVDGFMGEIVEISKSLEPGERKELRLPMSEELSFCLIIARKGNAKEASKGLLEGIKNALVFK